MGNCQKAEAVQPIQDTHDKLPDYYDKWYHGEGKTNKTGAATSHDNSHQMEIRESNTNLGIIKMLESHVYNSIGEKIDLKTHLNGKTLGLYFAGRWSSACKTFMPILTRFYKSHGKAKKLEIVFISSDESLEEFKMNFADMPWLALSYDQRHIKAVLSEKFNVTGIPLLIIINSDTGDIINLDARLSLELDKEGVQFPWKVEDAMRKKHSLILNKPLSYEPIQDFNSSSLITKKGFKF